MNITIQRLTLENFKCFKHKEIDFNPDVTTIQGRNGAGKTTIADAILWCLFGKNTQGQSDFDLKTHDENGKPIPNLDHSVELCLLCGDSIVTLKRTLKETWIKKRGSDEQVFKNNTTEYMVNGDSFTAADYKKYIASLIDESVFKCITNPSYFPSLKWQEQREFLSGLAGHIDVEDDDDEFKKLLAYLALDNSDIIAYRKHLSYQIKGIKGKLEKIPVRLEEQNKALPEQLDWNALESEAKEAYKEIAEVEKDIVAIRSGNGDDVRKDEIRKQLDEKYQLKRKEEENMQQRVLAIQKEHNEKVSELSNKFNSLLNNQRDIETYLSSFESLVKRCQETLEQCEKDAEDIRTKWADTQKPFDYDPVSTPYCPTCGQMLPQEQIEEKVNKMRQDFNIAMSSAKQVLTERANKVKATRADAEKELKELESKKEEAEKNLADIKEQINQVFAKKQNVERDKEAIPTYDFLCKNQTGYQAILFQIAELEKELQSTSFNSEDDEKTIESLNMKKALLTETISNVTAKIATRDIRLKILALIDGINEEKKDLVRQLSELERNEDVARRYQDRQNAVLEERINEHFSLVKWRMFRTVNNGGDPFNEPYCECYVEGVAYHDGLNQAARLNAGLDICEALCRHYNVSAPIIIDNSESTLNILKTTGQQLRLEVFDSELQIM